VLRRCLRGGRGFTLAELLVVMALIVLIMSILEEAFVEGVESFRKLKAIGDMQETLRGTENLDSWFRRLRVETQDFVFEGLRTNDVDPEEAADLADGYAEIERIACDLSKTLDELLRQTTNPVAKVRIERSQRVLERLKQYAAGMVDLLGLIPK